MERKLTAGPGLALLGKLAAILIILLVGYQLQQFPIATLPLAIIYVAYFAILCVKPHAWLIILPAAIPIFDLSPWSGRFLWGEFDHLVLITLAAALWRNNLAIQSDDENRISRVAILLVLGWQSLLLLNGLLPLSFSDAGFLTTYLDSSSALRGSKGFWQALLLFPLLISASNSGVNSYRRLGIGFIAGLCLCIASVLWERTVLIGLFDYSAQYRTTGLFSGMHIGGAFLDAYLALTIPFFALCFLYPKHSLFKYLGLALFAGALYTFIVTFSRANYLALLAILTLMFVAPRFLRGQVASFNSRKSLIALFVVGLFVITPIITGSFSKERLSQISQDLITRVEHWTNAVQVMDSGLLSFIVGEGKGRFPAYYRDRVPDGALLATATVQHEGSNSYVHFSPSDESGDLYVRQRFDNSPQGPYRLKIDLRGWNDKPEKLLIEVCERNILRSSPECNWIGIRLVGAPNGQWATYESDIDIGYTKASRLWWSRPIELSLLNRGLGSPIDIDNVSLLDAKGNNLLRNSDFVSGSDNWFISAGNHLSWHVKNIWVSAYFEGGILGLTAFIAVLAILLIRLKSNAQQGSKISLLLLCGLCGFLVIGIFDNVFDDPRISFLFYLIFFLCFVNCDRPSEDRNTLNLPWGTLVFSTSATMAVFLIAAFVYLMNTYHLNPRQLILRGMDSLELEAQPLRDLLAPTQQYAGASLDGFIVQEHPRILMPSLRSKSFAQRQRLLNERIEQYQNNGIAYLSPCNNSGILFEASCTVSRGTPEPSQQLVKKILDFQVVSPQPQGTYGNIWQLALAYDLLAEHFRSRPRERIAINEKLREGLKQTLLELDKTRAAAWHGRVSLAATAWITAVALDGNDETALKLRQRAQGHFLEAISILSTTEAWPEGYNYWIQNRAMLFALAAAAYTNGLENSEHISRVLATVRRSAHWSIYATRPDNKIEGIGDEGSRVDLKDETRRFIDLVAQLTADPVLSGYSKYLQKRFPRSSYYQGYVWGFLLFNDPAIEPVGDGTLQSLSPYLSNFELFGQHAMNLSYIRNGWKPEDTFISFKAGHVFSHHGHYDAGHFSIFKGKPLAINSSTYGNFTSPNRLNYSIRSVAKNTLLILRPNERVDSVDSEVSDGGQRVILPTSNPIHNLDAWSQNYREGMHLEGGELLASQQLKDSFSYMATDLTAAYNNREYDDNHQGGKVRKVTRQLLYLHDEDRLLINDLVETTRAEYTKKWLLHSINKPIAESLNVLVGSADNGILETPSKQTILENDGAFLHLNTILPHQAKTRFIGGKDYQFYVENDGDDRVLNGENHRVGGKKAPWFDFGMWRIEIQPSEPRLKDRFLNVLSPRIGSSDSDSIEELTTNHPDVTGVNTPTSATLFIPSRFKTWPINFELSHSMKRIRIVDPNKRIVSLSCSKSAPISTGNVTEYALNFAHLGTHNKVSCSILAK